MMTRRRPVFVGRRSDIWSDAIPTTGAATEQSHVHAHNLAAESSSHFEQSIEDGTFQNQNLND